MVTNASSRDPEATKARILAAVGEIDGVYSAFAARGNFWWSLADLTRDIDPARDSLARALKLLFRRHAEALRTRPVTLAVLAAELNERTPLVVALETVRERRALELVEWMAKSYPAPLKIDLAAITMVLGVAVNYLAVRARTIDRMSGVNIGEDAGWERIFAAIDSVIEAMVGDV